MGRLCEYAKDTSVMVVIEPMGKIHKTLTGGSVIKQLNHSHAGLLPDFNNFESMTAMSR